MKSLIQRRRLATVASVRHYLWAEWLIMKGKTNRIEDSTQKSSGKPEGSALESFILKKPPISLFAALPSSIIFSLPIWMPHTASSDCRALAASTPLSRSALAYFCRYRVSRILLLPIDRSPCTPGCTAVGGQHVQHPQGTTIGKES